MTYLEEQHVLYVQSAFAEYCEELDSAMAEKERLYAEQRHKQYVISYKKYVKGLLEGRGEF